MKNLEDSYKVTVLEPEDDTDIELDLAQEHQLEDDIQVKYNQLNERFISLKAILETLKNQVDKERELWRQELKATIEMEKIFRKKQKEQYKIMIPDESEMKRKFDIFRDFLFFTQATENIEKLTRKNSYQQWLSEVESECSLELDRIQKSLTALKPLREIASKWKDNIFIGEKGADGDKGNEDGKNEEKNFNFVDQSGHFSNKCEQNKF